MFQSVKLSIMFMVLLFSLSLMAGCATGPNTAEVATMSPLTEALVRAGVARAAHELGPDKVQQARDLIEDLKEIAGSEDAYLAIDNFEEYAVTLAVAKLGLLPEEEQIIRVLARYVRDTVRDGTGDSVRIRVAQILEWMWKALPAV